MGMIKLSKAGSHLALAVALATGTAAVSTFGFASAAHAQEEAQYSPEFIAAYQPANDLANGEGALIELVKPQLEALIPLSISPDEKIAAGGLIYNAGARSNDRALQLAGMELMLASGKSDPLNIPRFNFIAYQLANAVGDAGKAQSYLQSAIDLNFTSENVARSDMQIAMAEIMIADNRVREGLGRLRQAIDEQTQAGQPANIGWLRRGLSVAYEHEIVPEVYGFTTQWLDAEPNDANWRDAINIARNLNDYAEPETLDLLRLGRRVNSLTDDQDYLEYIDAADARLLPLEVRDVIQEGYASGVIPRDDTFVSESLALAERRISSDRADLPALERDARASGAGLRTVSAAGDAFLSYGEYSKAVEFYQKSLSMTGVDTARSLTRLGIAQSGMRQFAEAQATFAQVQGPRKPIAELWSTYAGQQAAPAAPVPAPPAPAPEPAPAS
ncbi:MAG: hypothetical protein ABJP48_01900 [Erythrobacter sp.]